MIELKESFKDRLEKALEKREMKPVDLSKATGISEPTISQYRSGYAKPKEKKHLLIANALHVDPSWLMGMDVPMEPRAKKTGESGTAAERESLYIQEADGVLCNLNEENVKRAIAYINGLLALQKAEEELK